MGISHHFVAMFIYGFICLSSFVLFIFLELKATLVRWLATRNKCTNGFIQNLVSVHMTYRCCQLLNQPSLSLHLEATTAVAHLAMRMVLCVIRLAAKLYSISSLH